MHRRLSVAGLVVGSVVLTGCGGSLPMSQSEVEHYVHSQLDDGELGDISDVSCESGLEAEIGDTSDCILNPDSDAPRDVRAEVKANAYGDPSVVLNYATFEIDGAD